ncbi:30S ribosomal protein S16 [Candidatus Parcubacteria bacterium]|nr:MAG: 30S ribosomal protein S16 [Candidatus Parcubacteria bacterium]
MLKIRFQRVGRKNQPHFRLVLTESTSSAKKKAKEILGFYDPVKKTSNVDPDRVKYWIDRGAQPSSTAHNFLVTKKVIEAKKIPVHKKAKPKEQVSTHNPQAAQPATPSPTA